MEVEEVYGRTVRAADDFQEETAVTENNDNGIEHFSEADDMDSDPYFVLTNESAVPSEMENEDSIGDVVGRSDDEGMPSAHHFVDISSSNVNNSVNSRVNINYEAVSNEHDDVADNPITKNGERYISLSE